MVEKTRGDAAKALEVAAAERVGERQHPEPAGHALHLGVKHETDAAHGFEDALRSVLAVLLVVVENNDGRKDNQRQRGSRDQKGKTDWQ